ncbi:hypothetical protein AA11826_1920 [Komagataeibacter oboediens DSM 11826]|nr:hypothetical protein AA11826_1920 [Komagataeibacter oboediens DSM 11826]
MGHVMRGKNNHDEAVDGYGKRMVQFQFDIPHLTCAVNRANFPDGSLNGLAILTRQVNFRPVTSTPG